MEVQVKAGRELAICCRGDGGFANTRFPVVCARPVRPVSLVLLFHPINVLLLPHLIHPFRQRDANNICQSLNCQHSSLFFFSITATARFITMPYSNLSKYSLGGIIMIINKRKEKNKKNQKKECQQSKTYAKPSLAPLMPRL